MIFHFVFFAQNRSQNLIHAEISCGDFESALEDLWRLS